MLTYELEAYDGTLVSVPEDKVEIWKQGQEKIKTLLSQGVSEEEIFKRIQNGTL